MTRDDLEEVCRWADRVDGDGATGRAYFLALDLGHLGPGRKNRSKRAASGGGRTWVRTSNATRVWRARIGAMIRNALAERLEVPLRGDWEIRVRAWTGRWRHGPGCPEGDADSLTESILDACQSAGVIVDDGKFRVQTGETGYSPRRAGQVWIAIRPILVTWDDPPPRARRRGP